MNSYTWYRFISIPGTDLFQCLIKFYFYTCYRFIPIPGTDVTLYLVQICSYYTWYRFIPSLGTDLFLYLAEIYFYVYLVQIVNCLGSLNVISSCIMHSYSLQAEQYGVLKSIHVYLNTRCFLVYLDC